MAPEATKGRSTPFVTMRYLSVTINVSVPYCMRFALIAPVLLGTVSLAARAQSAIHEYRPEVVITSPRIHGFGAQVLFEQHIETGKFAPNERIVGIGIVVPPFHALRGLVEVRQVQTPTAFEHRYIPTILSTVPLGAGFEMRNRTRVELRAINGAWSQRFQDRSAFGHDVEIAHVPVFTYGQFDVSYDSRFHTLNRIEKTAGARVPIATGASVDLFFTRQDDTRRATRLLYATGAIVRVVL